MMDLPVLDDMAEDAYQMQHWRTNVRVAGEGMGEREEVLETWVRLALSEGSQNASLRRIARARWARGDERAGHLPSSSVGQAAERGGGRGGAGRLLSW